MYAVVAVTVGQAIRHQSCFTPRLDKESADSETCFFRRKNKRKKTTMRNSKKAVRGNAIAAQEEKSSNGTEPTNAEEQSEIHVNDTSSLDAMLVGRDTALRSNGLPPMNKVSGTTNTVRRSVRLKNVALSGGTHAVNPAVEHVNLVGSDEERAPHSQRVSTLPVLSEDNLEGGPQVRQDNIMPDKSGAILMEKINYLVQAVDHFKTQGFGQASRSANTDQSSDFSYKTLYLDAQKKIDALLAENYELIKKLEYARGKVAAYERMKDASKAAKEVLFVRTTEAAAVSLSPQEVPNFNSPHPPPTAAAAAATGPLPPPPTTTAPTGDCNGKSTSKKRKAKN